MFTIGSLIPVEKYKKVAFFGYILSCIILIITLIPSIGVESGGAQRWIRIFGFQFQPVEFMKFWWAIAVSYSLSNKQNALTSFVKGIIPIFIIMVMPISLLLMQPDLGNSILLLLVSFTLLLLSPIKLRVLLLGLIFGAITVCWSVATHPYQLLRIKSFLNPWLDPLGINYHIIQSFTAIGSGGVFGFGIGESRLKYFYLPLHYSDFIFAILCEEGGLLLSCVVIFSFIAIMARGIQIALRHFKYSFEQFLAISLVSILMFQAIINICVVIGLFPITGIPLTFISYGGTSLLSSLFSFGVLYRLGRNK